MERDGNRLGGSAYALIILGFGNLLANVAGGLLLGALFSSTRNTWIVAIPHAALVATLLALA